ncbi:MAG: tRNA 2-thiocytidine biosynthesis protein TtcA [Vallitaleaceae bacterium]|nr:tRNA 2-thiocytidine biosynthesis protein TtcA [Vallitaleaceae bacterium]
MERVKEIERSLITTYKKKIWKPFVKSVIDYELIQENDKIAVCISGGKDSMILAKCMQELQRHGKFHFDLVFLVMDPGYNKENRQRIIDNAAILGIPIQIFNSDIFDIVTDIEDSPCYLCARMRRGYLYKNAQDLGCNKIALGHHFDDVIETTLMGMFYSGQIETMMPKLRSTNFEGMELIRPLYHVKEANIIAWKNHHHLQFIQCACRFTENCSIQDNSVAGSKRSETKQLIKKLRQTNEYVDQNIFNSIHSVNLNKIIGYKKDGVRHSFLDEYNQP